MLSYQGAIPPHFSVETESDEEYQTGSESGVSDSECGDRLIYQDHQTEIGEPFDIDRDDDSDLVELDILVGFEDVLAPDPEPHPDPQPHPEPEPEPHPEPEPEPEPHPEPEPEPHPEPEPEPEDTEPQSEDTEPDYQLEPKPDTERHWMTLEWAMNNRMRAVIDSDTDSDSDHDTEPDWTTNQARLVNQAHVWGGKRKRCAPTPLDAIKALGTTSTGSVSEGGNTYRTNPNAADTITQRFTDHLDRPVVNVLIVKKNLYPVVREFFVRNQDVFAAAIPDIPDASRPTFDVNATVVKEILHHHLPTISGSYRILWHLEDSLMNPKWLLGFYPILVMLCDDAYFGFQWLPSENVTATSGTKRLHMLSLKYMHLYAPY